MEDDLQILTLPYNNDIYSIHNKTNNIKILIVLTFQIILTIIHWILSFIFPVKQDYFYLGGENITKPNLFNSYNLTIYCHLILYIITLSIRFYLKNIYYKRLRILGYNNHHDRVKKFVLFPSFVLHKSNALLLLVTVIIYNINDAHINSFHIKPIYCAEVIISIASILIITNIVLNLYHEIKFRRIRNPPDVFCVDDPSSRLTSDGLNQVAIRSSSFLEDLLENQADLIYNLKLQNSHLRELLYKTLQHNNQINSVTE